MFKDILLPLGGFPDPTPAPGIEAAVALARRFGGRITALAIHQDFHVPSNVLASALLDLPGMVASARERAAENARTVLATFDRAAGRLGTPADHVSVRCLEAEMADVIVRHARLHDLTMLVSADTGALHQWLAEGVIFGAGRPVMVLPANRPPSDPAGPLRVGVAWDGTRAAARALADAMPILERAAAVTVVTVHGEKALPDAGDGLDLRRHLGVHGITAECIGVSADGRSVGDTLRDVAAERSLDLLVMGAYAHSRLRSFVLGGATQSMIAAPSLPVFLSH